MNIIDHYVAIHSLTESVKPILDEFIPECTVESNLEGRYEVLSALPDLEGDFNALREEWETGSPKVNAFLSCSQYIAVKLYAKALEAQERRG